MPRRSYKRKRTSSLSSQIARGISRGQTGPTDRIARYQAKARSGITIGEYAAGIRPRLMRTRDRNTGGPGGYVTGLGAYNYGGGEDFYRLYNDNSYLPTRHIKKQANITTHQDILIPANAGRDAYWYEQNNPSIHHEARLVMHNPYNHTLHQQLYGDFIGQGITNGLNFIPVKYSPALLHTNAYTEHHDTITQGITSVDIDKPIISTFDDSFKGPLNKEDAWLRNDPNYLTRETPFNLTPYELDTWSNSRIGFNLGVNTLVKALIRTLIN